MFRCVYVYFCKIKQLKAWYWGTPLMTYVGNFITFEPQHDKTNNVAVCPEKTQISLGICPV